MRKFLISILCISVTLNLLTVTVLATAYNWDRVPKISSKSDLARYIETNREADITTIPVILSNGLTITLEETLQLNPASLVSRQIISNDGQNIKCVFSLKEYPGTKVANAYLSGNTSYLTPDERELYNVAVEIVREANKRNSETNMEYYIYEQIMYRTQYFTGNMDNQPRFVTAIGALVDGKANCQGYTDAFYMLGKMLGLNVGRMSGTAGGGPHAWNYITFDDGKTYCVDVTWGDEGFSPRLNSYIYFNAPMEIMQVTHSWDQSLAPAIHGSIDYRYSYGNLENSIIYEGKPATLTSSNSNSERTNNAKKALEILAQRIAVDQKTWYTVMTPFDQNFSTFELAKPYFSSKLKELGFKRTCWLIIKKYGKYMFLAVHTFE